MLRTISASGSVDANEADGYGGRGVLHWSAIHGNVEMLQYWLDLTKEHCNVNLQASDGNTALHDAVLGSSVVVSQETSFQIIDCLLKAGADATIRNRYGNSPLSVSSREIKNHIISKMFERYKIVETTLLSVCDVIRPNEDEMDIEYEEDDSNTFLTAFINNVVASRQMLDGILSYI